MRINQEAKEELKFWLSNYDFKEGYTIKPFPVTTKMIFTDASATQYGGYTVTKIGECIVNGKFTQAEMKTSSTNREILAVKYTIDVSQFLL